jgi:hypothetical protein
MVMSLLRKIPTGHVPVIESEELVKNAADKNINTRCKKLKNH